MGQSELSKALQELIESGEGRSETNRLGELLEHIEEAQRAGVLRESILKALQEHGFTFTLRGFETALYRLRKRRKAANTPEALAKAKLATALASSRK
jgi:radical SAM superfamily enzyme YgiQ (UPF0313 family)